MPRKFLLKISFALAIPAAFAQSFEVATIKPAMPPAQRRAMGVNNRFGTKGGPGTDDPGLFTCNMCSVLDLVEEAYQLTQSYQISPHGTQDDPRFDFTAKVPAGATRAQFRAMLIDLLNDRFKLSVHKEKREMPVLELVVAKGGPKLKESVDVPAEPELAPARGAGRAAVVRDQDGFPITNRPMPKGGFNVSSTGLARIEGKSETMQDLAERLDGLLSKPVIDGTGLTKKYDYRITFSSATILANGGRGRGDAPSDPNTPLASAPDNAGTTIEGAIQSQLGLKLESKKAPVEVLVIDHAEKSPTEN
jgi:uncharacterized protein (TIGR03435 family)